MQFLTLGNLWRWNFLALMRRNLLLNRTWNKLLKITCITDNLLTDICNIIENAQKIAIKTVNITLVMRNWLLGQRIASENMDGNRSERYGAGIIEELADKLTNLYGKGFDKRALYRYVKFYQLYPEIVGTVSPQSIRTDSDKIMETVSPQSQMRYRLLSWSHYERLIQIENPVKRAWYEKEAIEQWSTS